MICVQAQKQFVTQFTCFKTCLLHLGREGSNLGNGSRTAKWYQRFEFINRSPKLLCSKGRWRNELVLFRWQIIIPNKVLSHIKNDNKTDYFIRDCKNLGPTATDQPNNCCIHNYPPISWAIRLVWDQEVPCELASKWFELRSKLLKL